MAEATPPGKPKSARSAREAQLEEERVRDVQLLLESMLKREESTVKLILDSLYDIGSINLINQKLQNRSLNHLTKGVAKLSKPAFRIIALRWFNNNCPQLITNWLYSKVKFKPAQPPPPVTISPATVSPATVQQPVALARVEGSNVEIQRLNSQIKVLTTLLLGVTFSLGGAIAWTVWQDHSMSLNSVKHPHPASVEKVQNQHEEAHN